MAGLTARIGSPRGALGQAVRLFAAAIFALSVVTCGSNPRASGFYYAVKPGDNVFRIGQRYGVPTEVLVRTNKIHNVHAIPVGTRLWIPAKPTRSSKSAQRAAAKPRPAYADLRKKVRAQAKRESQLAFAWPMRGKLTSRYGHRGGRPHEGIDLAAAKGSTIRAAESGKVIHSGRLGDYGKVVILKHAGDFRSVYAHTRKIYVRKGQFVERGDRIAEVGTSGRATGPHLHFEIRRREVARDPILYLP